MYVVEPGKMIQVKIFQGESNSVQKSFNRFMEKLNEHISIYKIDTDTDNGYCSKITVFFCIDKDRMLMI